MGAYNKIKACRHGQVIFNQFDQYVGRSFDLYGEFSEGEVAMFRQIIEPDMLVLDVGANIGAHTIVMSQLVGPAGLVHAFEPQRLVYQTLAGNMAINSLTNVICHQKALGNKPGTLLVPFLDYANVANYGGLELGHWTEGEPVDIITIDSLDLPNCNFIKMDVEGMEQIALEGAVNTIKSFRPYMYVENDRKEKSDGLVRFIDSLNYDMYWHLTKIYNQNNFANNSENIFGEVVSVNMLCVPREADVEIPDMKRVEVPRS
jgi:FkbM family methyltransferase